jgi:hypothetical protein
MHEHRRQGEETVVVTGSRMVGDRRGAATLVADHGLRPAAGALSAIGSLLGSLFLGLGLMFALRVAIAGLVMAVIGGRHPVGDHRRLAPTFGAVKSSTNAARSPPTRRPRVGGWDLSDHPAPGSLIAFVGALYALYLLYLGLMR